MFYDSPKFCQTLFLSSSFSSSCLCAFAFKRGIQRKDAETQRRKEELLERFLTTDFTDNPTRVVTLFGPTGLALGPPTVFTNTYLAPGPGGTLAPTATRPNTSARNITSSAEVDREITHNTVLRMPAGPTVVITPWNAPFMLSTWKWTCIPPEHSAIS